MIISASGERDRRKAAEEFVREFLDAEMKSPRILFGRNVYANDLIHETRIDAVVDDFSSSQKFCDIPIIRSEEIPADLLVLALSGGRPLTVKDKLDAQGVRNLDYFAFQKIANIPLRAIVFNEGFEEDFRANADRYAWVRSLLHDEESVSTYDKIISFRLKCDIELLRGFTHREERQYFEEFLELKDSDEVFFDVGCFDGFTSLEFVRRCAGYKEAHAFEPEPRNFENCASRLASLPRVYLHQFGLASKPGEFWINEAGSASCVGSSGTHKIKVADLDSMNLVPPTFLKMDIEGAERDALAGAARTVADANPRLAIAVYHHTRGTGPFWQIPQDVLSISANYRLILCHYTESIYETIMFFLPN